jgi:hypothetical protein
VPVIGIKLTAAIMKDEDLTDSELVKTRWQFYCNENIFYGKTTRNIR